MEQLLRKLSEAGTENGLAFTSQQILKHTVFGLDGIHRKILVLMKEDDGPPQSFIIDLHNVQSCSVKKVYGSIKSGELKHHILEEYLEEMSLHFDLGNEKPPVEILFYKRTLNHVSEIPKLELKARYWETMLCKLQVLPQVKNDTVKDYTSVS